MQATGGGAPGGSPTRTPNLVGFGPHFLPTERGKEEEGGGKRGGRAASPCPIRIGARGRAHLVWPASSPPLSPIRPNNFPGGFR